MAPSPLSAQRALALAIGARIVSLEDRARAAISGDREDLALQAAETIAELEMDRDAALQAQATLISEIARLQTMVHESERRFTDLQRGRRVVRLGTPSTELDCRALWPAL